MFEITMIFLGIIFLLMPSDAEITARKVMKKMNAQEAERQKKEKKEKIVKFQQALRRVE